MDVCQFKFYKCQEKETWWKVVFIGEKLFLHFWCFYSFFNPVCHKLFMTWWNFFQVLVSQSGMKITLIFWRGFECVLQGMFHFYSFFQISLKFPAGKFISFNHRHDLGDVCNFLLNQILCRGPTWPSNFFNR